MSRQGWNARILLFLASPLAASIAAAAPHPTSVSEQRDGILVETQVTIGSGSKPSTAKGRVIMDSELVSWTNVAQSPDGYVVMARRVSGDSESFEIELKVVSNKKGESRVLATPVVRGTLGHPLQMTDGSVVLSLRAQKVHYEMLSMPQ